MSCAGKENIQQNKANQNGSGHVFQHQKTAEREGSGREKSTIPECRGVGDGTKVEAEVEEMDGSVCMCACVCAYNQCMNLTKLYN